VLAGQLIHQLRMHDEISFSSGVLAGVTRSG
jgi:hypothetical protein